MNRSYTQNFVTCQWWFTYKSPSITVEKWNLYARDEIGRNTRKLFQWATALEVATNW